MIIVKVQGGIGNQLMQYSIGRVIALMFEKEVAYDITFFDTDATYTKRPYLLDMFTTKVRVASKEEIEKTRYPYGFFSKLTLKAYKVINKFFLKKYYVGYDPDFLSYVAGKDSLYIEGFWQSYKYYEKVLQELSNEISLQDTHVLQKVKSETSFNVKNSVSVHIRRGDFLKKNAGTTALGKEFYEEAVPLLEKIVHDPSYFIFSDDVEWVRSEMGHLFKEVTYVASYHMTDYEEFALMKDCKHAVIANSTFSWFSALLSDREDKVVIYSKDWKNQFLNKDLNICPQDWKGI